MLLSLFTLNRSTPHTLAITWPVRRVRIPSDSLTYPHLPSISITSLFHSLPPSLPPPPRSPPPHPHLQRKSLNHIFGANPVWSRDFTDLSRDMEILPCDIEIWSRDKRDLTSEMEIWSRDIGIWSRDKRDLTTLWSKMEKNTDKIAI